MSQSSGMTGSAQKRVLAIDPTHRGFGYVIFERPDFLIDCGVRHVEGLNIKASTAAAAELIARYHPRIMVLEDVAANGCRGASEFGNWLTPWSGTAANGV